MQSAAAKDALQGFKITPTHAMKISFAKKWTNGQQSAVLILLVVSDFVCDYVHPSIFKMYLYHFIFLYIHESSHSIIYFLYI